VPWVAAVGFGVGEDCGSPAAFIIPQHSPPDNLWRRAATCRTGQRGARCVMAARDPPGIGLRRRAMPRTDGRDASRFSCNPGASSPLPAMPGASRVHQLPGSVEGGFPEPVRRARSRPRQDALTHASHIDSRSTNRPGRSRPCHGAKREMPPRGPCPALPRDWTGPRGLWSRHDAPRRVFPPGRERSLGYRLDRAGLT